MKSTSAPKSATPRTGYSHTELSEALNVPQVRDWWRSHWRALDLPVPSNGGRLPDVVKTAWANRNSAATQQAIHDHLNRPAESNA